MLSGALSLIELLLKVVVPLAVLVILLREHLFGLLRSAAGADIAAKVLAAATRGAIWITALALPLVTWICYLHLSYYGIANDKVLDAAYRQYPMIEEWGGAGVQPHDPQAS